VAPKPLSNGLDVYTKWFGQLGSRRHNSFARRLIWRWSMQMGLNTALIAALFISAGYLFRHPPPGLRQLGWDEEGLKAALWLAAAVLSLPMVIATFRKLQALGLLLAETQVSLGAAGPNTAAVRAVVAQVVPVAGAIALGLFVVVLSSALLPSFRIWIVLLVIVALTGWLLWRSFIRIYSKAQVALEETFAHDAGAHTKVPAALPSLLREADLEAISLEPGSQAVRKLIRELELRTRTGASIVALERHGTNIINPGPDEELQAGDQVLLLGTRSQLEAAKTALRAA
jgi:CPA2 family monovalent cation:H+ antiporter-2